jgi:hypothetical protein
MLAENGAGGEEKVEPRETDVMIDSEGEIEGQAHRDR